MAVITRIINKDFDKIIVNYNIGKVRSRKHIWWALANTVYILHTTEGRYVLKTFEESDIEHIKYQVRIMNYLNRKKSPVPGVVKTKNGKNILLYNDKRMIVQKFVLGMEAKRLNPGLIKNIARKQSIINKYLLQLKKVGKFAWKMDYQFNPLRDGVNGFEDFNLLKDEKEYLKAVKSLDKRKLRRGVIHGDFHTSHILHQNNKVVAFIDWGDVHEDYISQELSVFIAHSFFKTKRPDVDGIHLYLDEYQKNLKLNDEEIKAVYLFIWQRFLGAISWCVRQCMNHPDKKEKINYQIRKLIRQYRTYRGLTYDESINFI